MQLETLREIKNVLFRGGHFLLAFGAASSVIYTLADTSNLACQIEKNTLSNVALELVASSPLLYLAGGIVSLTPPGKRKPSFKFNATEWRIERRPGVPDSDELCQWFVTRIEKEELDENEEQEPLVLRKVAIENDRCISFWVDEDILDDHCLWEYFDVCDRRGLDGKIFVSRQLTDGHMAIRKLIVDLHENEECRNLA